MRMKNSGEQSGSFGPSVLCITTNKYLVRVLVVLLHAHFCVVSPIPFLLAGIFSPGHPYIGSTTVLPNYCCFSIHTSRIILFLLVYHISSNRVE